MRALVVLLLAACSAEDRRSAPPPPPPALTGATQADFARELEAAERNGTWLELRRRWQGQRLRWTVTRQRALCASADACNVAAFPIQRPAKHGWMPELAFARGQYDALAARCTADPCEVTIDGTLAKLEASDELPTRLRFEGVAVIR